MPLHINGKQLQNAYNYGTITIQGDSLTCLSTSGNAIKYIFGKNATITVEGSVETLQVMRGDARINIRTATKVQTEEGDIYITHSCKKVHSDSGNVIFPPTSDEMSNPSYDLRVEVFGTVECVKTTKADVWVAKADEVTTFSGSVTCHGCVDDATTETGCIAGSSRNAPPPTRQPSFVPQIIPRKYTRGAYWLSPSAMGFNE